LSADTNDHVDYFLVGQIDVGWFVVIEDVNSKIERYSTDG